MMERLGIALALAVMLAPAQACAQAELSGQPVITREQARQRAQQLFAQFDVNHDGIVTRKEAKAVGARLLMQRAATGRDVAPGIGGHTLHYLENAFAGMQWATEEQFERAFLAHFDQMDTNHDGVLTPAERQEGRQR